MGRCHSVLIFLRSCDDKQFYFFRTVDNKKVWSEISSCVIIATQLSGTYQPFYHGEKQIGTWCRYWIEQQKVSKWMFWCVKTIITKPKSKPSWQRICQQKMSLLSVPLLIKTLTKRWLKIVKKISFFKMIQKDSKWLEHRFFQKNFFLQFAFKKCNFWCIKVLIRIKNDLENWQITTMKLLLRTLNHANSGSKL